MTNCENSSRVLIVEDRHETAQRLKNIIDSSPDLVVCGMADDVYTGLNKLFDLKPRIVLIDLGLPDGSGNDIIHAVSKASWQCDSIVLSIFGDEARVVQALHAGAKGYILKSGSLETISSDIFSVINGGSPISPQIARYLLSLVQTHKLGKTETKHNFMLTKREMQILDAVAKGYKRKEIGERFDISTGTVGNHINSIYQKLNVSSNTEAIAEATKKGLI